MKKKLMRTLMMALAAVTVLGVSSTAMAAEKEYDQGMKYSWTVYCTKESYHTQMRNQIYKYLDARGVPTQAWSLISLNGVLQSGRIYPSESAHITYVAGSGSAALRQEPLQQGTYLYAQGMFYTE